MKGSLKRPDCEIYYEVTGSGPALVFVHGLGGNILSWWQQIPHFEKKFTCVTFSHRGFWPNAFISEIPEISVFADDLSALIDHLKLDSVSLVAQSFGGWSCLEYALRKQSQVSALIMASTTGTLNYESIEHPEIVHIQQWKVWADQEKSNLRAHGILPGAGRRMADEQAPHYYLFKHINELSPTDFKESLRVRIHNTRTLSPKKFSELKIPVCFITGEEDLLFPPTAAAAAASLLSDAHWKSIPKAGHSTYFECPKVFNNIVDEYLSSVNK